MSSEQKEKILASQDEVLTLLTNDFQKTTVIARAYITNILQREPSEFKGLRKIVNPALYKLLNGKKVIKKSADNGTKPEWKLAGNKVKINPLPAPASSSSQSSASSSSPAPSSSQSSAPSSNSVQATTSSANSLTEILNMKKKKKRVVLVPEDEMKVDISDVPDIPDL